MTGCLRRLAPVLVALAVVVPAAATAEDIIDYARQCAAAIAPVPAFNCLDGVVVPVTVNGEAPARYVAGMTCDRPALLPLGTGSDGQCVPYSRVLLLADGEVQISALCRRKYIRDETSPRFDEVDVIAHNPRTGSTCWFQAEAPTAEGFDASRVPSPSGGNTADGVAAARAFWHAPEKTADAGCGNCHDSDPFMYSPFIAQVWEHIPSNPFGWYANDIGAAFRQWPKSQAISTRGNTCTGCHRIGSLFTCRRGILESAGAVAIDGANAWAQNYPASHWMPPGNAHSRRDWTVVYEQAVSELSACCDDPGRPDCIVEPITGKPE